MFLIEYIKKYKVTYISVIATFVIGVCIGIFVTFKIPQEEKNQINNYLQDTIKVVTEKRVDKQSLFKEKLAENLKDVRYNMVIRLYNYSKFYNLYFYDL